MAAILNFMYIPMVDYVSILLPDSGVPVDTKTVEKPFVSIFSSRNFNMIALLTLIQSKAASFQLHFTLTELKFQF